MYVAPPSANLKGAFRAHAAQMGAVDRLWHHAMAGLMGLSGGLVLVIPAVLWITGHLPFGGASAPIAAVQAVAPTKPEVTDPPVMRVRTIGVEATDSASTTPKMWASSTASLVPSATAQNDAQLSAARDHVRAGNITAARKLLERREMTERGDALFLLAETWDPNVLAALGIRSATAEPNTARKLYEAAGAKGIAAARQRIEALR